MKIFRAIFVAVMLCAGMVPTTALAAFAFNASAANGAVANTVTISPTTGAMVVVFSETSGGGGTPTVTCSDNSGSTWVNASNNVVVTGLHYSVCYTLSAAAGVTTITATYNGGTPGTTILAAFSYTGLTSPSFVAVSTPNTQASPGTGTNAVTTIALACGSTNALFIGYSGDSTGSNGGLTVGTGFTQRLNAASLGGQAFGEDPNAEVTGSQTATWTAATHSTDTYGSVGVCFADNAFTGTGGPLGFRIF